MSPGAHGLLSALFGRDFLHEETAVACGCKCVLFISLQEQLELEVLFFLNIELEVPLTEDPGVHVTRTGSPSARLPTESDGPSQIQRLQQSGSPQQLKKYQLKLDDR
jgi:hypothetical protein